MVVKSIKDKAFKKYGRVLKDYNCTEIIEKMKETPLLKEVIYEPSVPVLENLYIAKELENRAFGQLPIQIGYCNGNNYQLNAVEYHRSSEINIAATDLILLLGSQQDIEDDYTYDTSKIEAFKIPKGTAIEVYATTLHYAPCNTDEAGFKCVVILPKATNLPLSLEEKVGEEDKLLFARNKWLISHKEAAIEGAFNGLVGENIDIR